MGTHDAVHNTFVAIAWNVNFHVGQKQLHMLPPTIFHSFHQWIDIVLTKDGIHILVDVVIVDPTWVDLFCRSYATWRFVAFKIAQAKKRSYCNQHPIGHFFHLTIEVFECLDKQVDVFIHDCPNVMWNFKEPRGFLFFVLVFFFHSNFLIILQKIQASSILNQAIMVALTTSQLPPLRNTPSITPANLLQTIDYWDTKILTPNLC
jgi:hypothetical protein